jgi:hypothetical protein
MALFEGTMRTAVIVLAKLLLFLLLLAVPSVVGMCVQHVTRRPMPVVPHTVSRPLQWAAR